MQCAGSTMLSFSIIITSLPLLAVLSSPVSIKACQVSGTDPGPSFLFSFFCNLSHLWVLRSSPSHPFILCTSTLMSCPSVISLQLISSDSIWFHLSIFIVDSFLHLISSLHSPSFVSSLLRGYCHYNYHYHTSFVYLYVALQLLDDIDLFLSNSSSSAISLYLPLPPSVSPSHSLTPIPLNTYAPSFSTYTLLLNTYTHTHLYSPRFITLFIQLSGLLVFCH